MFISHACAVRQDDSSTETHEINPDYSILLHKMFLLILICIGNCKQNDCASVCSISRQLLFFMHRTFFKMKVQVNQLSSRNHVRTFFSFPGSV